MLETRAHPAIGADRQGPHVLESSCTESCCRGNFRCPFRTRLGKKAWRVFWEAAGSPMRNLRWQLRSSSPAAANLLSVVVANSAPHPRS